MNPSHFDVRDKPARQQFLAWRDRVGHVIDVLPAPGQTEEPFHGEIDRYQVGDYLFTDCISDALLLERSIARISTDNKRDYVFHVFTSGRIETLHSGKTYHANAHGGASIVALDLNQPIRMKRSDCRVLTFFASRERVETIFPHADSIHGRVFENTTHLTQLLIEQAASLAYSLPWMSVDVAQSRIENCTQLLVTAFSKQANLSGSARAAIRAAMFDRARRYIQKNLHQASLTPENILEALQLTRTSLYRLFEHEGGLAAYIRDQRLREAADELIRFPNLSILEISYGLGFKSASDFARAFRRKYDMSPQELRDLALERQNKLQASSTNWK